WRRDRDSNPGRALTLAGVRDRSIQPLCHPSSAGNTTGHRVAVNGIMPHQVTRVWSGCFDCPRLSSMIQDMKGSSALQLLEPSTMQMQERHTTLQQAGVNEAEVSKLFRNTYSLLAMTLAFSAIVAFISMTLNLRHPGLIITLVGFYGFLF